MFCGAALGDTALVRRHLKKDVSGATARDLGGLTALQCSAGSRLGRHDEPTRRRLLEVAVCLLDAGADSQAKTQSWDHDVDAIYFAASARHLELFELLLQRGADATEALTPALWNSTEEFAEIALKYGGDVNRARASDRPLLNDLVRWGQLRQSFWLLEHGASPNLADDRGWTAVHQAASRGNERLLKAVLAAGGDPSQPDLEGRTPLEVTNRRQLKKLSPLLRHQR